MIQIKKIKKEYFVKVLDMMCEMYKTDAVDHKVARNTLEKTLQYSLGINPYLFCYVFLYNEDIVGFGFISKSFCTEIGGKIVFFEDIYIKDGYRSLGIGKKYFDYIFKNHKANRYRLEVTNNNIRAINLYKKLGFDKLNYLQMIKDCRS